MRVVRHIAILTALILALSAINAAGQETDLSTLIIRNSNDQADTTTGPHGGRMIQRRPFTFEIVFDPDGIRIFLLDSLGAQMKPDGVEGTCLVSQGLQDSERINFQVKKDPNREYARVGSTVQKRGYHLFAACDFSLIEDRNARIRVDLTGLPSPELPETSFAMLYGMSRLRGWVCRGHENRLFLEYKDYDLCDKQYLDEAPFLFQCPNHANSRAHTPSKCPLCGSELVPVKQMRVYELPPLGEPPERRGK